MYEYWRVVSTAETSTFGVEVCWFESNLASRSMITNKHQRKYYERNKEKFFSQSIINGMKYKDRNRKYVLEYLKTHPCVDCGFTNPICLEFDHITTNKRQSVSNLIARRVSIETLQIEIDKCEVVCSNCHAIRTSTRGNHYRSKI